MTVAMQESGNAGKLQGREVVLAPKSQGTESAKVVHTRVICSNFNNLTQVVIALLEVTSIKRMHTLTIDSQYRWVSGIG